MHLNLKCSISSVSQTLSDLDIMVTFTWLTGVSAYCTEPWWLPFYQPTSALTRLPLLCPSLDYSWHQYWTGYMKALNLKLSFKAFLRKPVCFYDLWKLLSMLCIPNVLWLYFLLNRKRVLFAQSIQRLRFFSDRTQWKDSKDATWDQAEQTNHLQGV